MRNIGSRKKNLYFGAENEAQFSNFFGTKARRKTFCQCRKHNRDNRVIVDVFCCCGAIFRVFQILSPGKSNQNLRQNVIVATRLPRLFCN